MIGGFALAAAPAQYRVTGVMTFIVGPDGVVYEKDLGPGTLKTFQASIGTIRTRLGSRLRMNGLQKQYLRNSAWQNGVSPCFACASSNTRAGFFAWLAALSALWAFGALYFDFPKGGPFAAILFVIALLAVVIFVRRKLLKLGILFGACAVVASWC